MKSAGQARGAIMSNEIIEWEEGAEALTGTRTDPGKAGRSDDRYDEPQAIYPMEMRIERKAITSNEIIEKIRRKAEQEMNKFDGIAQFDANMIEYEGRKQTYLLLQIFDKLENINNSIKNIAGNNKGLEDNNV
jgi:hypothetical protein